MNAGAKGASGASGAMPAGTSAGITPTANSDSAIAGGAGGGAGAGSGSPSSSGWSTDGAAKIAALSSTIQPKYMSDAAASQPNQAVPTTPTTQAPSDSAAAVPTTPQPAPGGRTNWRPPPQGTATNRFGGTVTTGPLVGSNQSRDPATYLPPAPPHGPYQGVRSTTPPATNAPSGPGPMQSPVPGATPGPVSQNQGQGIPTGQAPYMQTALAQSPLPGGVSPGLAQQTQGLGARMAGYMGNSDYGGTA